jgi:DNA-directed RNA polymerase specialized sigma24 family protein
LEDRVYQLLEQADWEQLTLKLMEYASKKLRNLKWRDGRSLDSLPKGMTVEDLVCEAIMRVWDGERKWNPDKAPEFGDIFVWSSEKPNKSSC